MKNSNLLTLLWHKSESSLSFSTFGSFYKRMSLVFLITLLAQHISSAQGFYISGNQLRDANGNNFIMKGFAIPTAWFVGDVNNNIGNMKNKTGANCMRIVCTTGMNENDWKTSVQNCINNQVIPMVELHDATCVNDWNRLNDMAKYWAARASYLTSSGVAKYILINIANEWGDGSQSNSNWREAYKTAITTIRNAGINTTLVIDAPGCGQDNNNASTIRTYGKDLLNHDPKHNLLFSIHMYGVWTPGNNSDPQTGIQLLKDSGLPFIVGEFADRGSYGDYDETKILSKCASVGAGWLAWSWKGNNEPILDMSNDWAGNSLTTWGNTAVWGSNGTKTASPASVFSGGGGGGGGTTTVSNGTYKITARHSGKSLDVEGLSTADGGNVVQYGYVGNNNQKWFVQDVGGGTYTIKSVNSGKVLDVSGASTADGADINQWTYYGNNNQKWKIESAGSGYYRIVSVNSSKCVDVAGASTSDAAPIQQWSCNGGNNQSFTFEKLSSATSRIEDTEEMSLERNINVYPNPSAGSFTITEAGSFNYVIRNSAGSTVEQGKGKNQAIVGSSFAQGFYLLQVQTAKGRKQAKLIKQ